jgi:hypothetical protein
MSTLYKAEIGRYRLTWQQAERAKHGACPHCGDFFITKPAPPFWINEGFGFSWEVRHDCGLCPRCLEALRQETANRKPPTQYRPAIRSLDWGGDVEGVGRIERETIYETGAYPEGYTGIAKNERCAGIY